MNDDLLADIKQLFAASENRIVSKLTRRMADGFAGVAEAIDKIHDLIDNHEHRIVKLEKSTFHDNPVNAK